MSPLRIRHCLWVLAALTLCGCKSKSDDIHTFMMGERAQVGPLIYNAFDTQWLVKLGDGESAHLPQNRFFMVKMTIVNGGSAETSVPSLTLVDDVGQSYPELTSGEGIPNWIGLIRKLRPAETLQGNAAFDVPPKHYKLRVADEMEQYAWVDIPLRFEPDTNKLPPLPTRGDDSALPPALKK